MIVTREKNELGRVSVNERAEKMTPLSSGSEVRA